MAKGTTGVRLIYTGIGSEERTIRYEFHPPLYPGELLAKFSPSQLIKKMEETGKCFTARGDVRCAKDARILDGVVAQRSGGLITLCLSSDVALRVMVGAREIITCNHPA